MIQETITRLPDGVEGNRPKRAREIREGASDSAEEPYGEEDRAHRVAAPAVEGSRE